ncbi:MBOAT family protein [Ruminococcus sp. CLA-AA-H200]|uniref:MBOAT family protein n=1 Tax=Ruminococcus turbiniformis TaxID=2881258 RepID=A0ABS8FWM9_9FIRM|nr:MBOAT family O-acyltransferase [Ruminococcus turbiniformis]MCC2254342.1 MBOAT family protein [Ruminococcus turbiniformis]
MLFSSITFLFLFLPVVLAVYYIVPFKAKNIVLLIASLFFYAWGEPVYVILMILSIMLNYFCGRDIKENEEDPRRAKLGVIFAVAANLFVLGFFKYYGFLIETLNAMLPIDIPYRELPLPVGISFYTFQAISYILDVYWKKAQPQNNILYFALYISMFPQLIAGPIVQYADIEEQLRRRHMGIRKIGEGAQLFIIGLAKKVILANSTGAVFEQVSGMAAGNLSILTAWIGVFSYAFQIYFDFSGYSDMALGLGRMFGFEFRKNFDYPYVSKSVTEFWRRWHISLSTWFREYVYIPLGGNRCSVSRNIFNLMVVWALTGMWHGAAWNFIAWGVYYGVILVLEKYVWGAYVDRLPNVVRHIYAGVLVLVGWVFFFSPSLGYAIRYLFAMIGGGAGIVDSEGAFLLVTHWLLYLVSVLGCSAFGMSVLRGVIRAPRNAKLRTAAAVVIYIGMFLISVAFLVTDTFNPFLYFRF